jgi:hypothetical protein
MVPSNRERGFIMVRIDGTEYMGVFAHKSWLRKSLPRRLWTYADVSVSYHFPGEDRGVWVKKGRPTREGFQKWELIKK